MLKINKKFIKILEDAFKIERHRYEKSYVVLCIDDKKELISEDIQHGILARFNLENTVESDENIICDIPRELLDFLKKVEFKNEDEFTLDLVNSTDLFINGKQALSVNKNSASSFNFQNENPTKIATVLSNNVGSLLLEASQYATSSFEKQSQPALHGVLLMIKNELLTIGSTDTSVLFNANVNVDCDCEYNRNIPSDSLGVVSRFLNCSFDILSDYGFVYFKTKDAIIRCNVLEKDFCSTYKRVSSMRPERTACVIAKNLCNEIEAVCTVNDELRKLYFEINSDCIRIFVSSQLGKAERIVDCRYGKNKPVTLMCFDARKLIKCLRSIKSDEVKMIFNEDSPLVLEDKANNMFTMIMPLAC